MKSGNVRVGLHKAYVWYRLQAEAFRFTLDVLLADGRAPFEQPQGKLHLL